MMETLHAASIVLTDWLVETSVHVAVLFALVLGASALLGKRLPARWRYALWMLVLLRLLLPAIPSSPASVHNVARLVTPPAQVHVEPVAPRVAPRIAPMGAAPVAQLVQSSPATPATPSWPWRSAAVLLWALGVLVALARLLWMEVRFARLVRSEPVLNEARVTAALADVLQVARVRRRVEVVRTDLGDGPALTGLWRPRILVPGRVLDRLSDDELRHVLAHEVAHLAAGDVLQNWVLAVLEAVHWFNPLVRVAAARVRTERETLRDLAATRGAPRAGRAAYGRTLLRLLETGARRSSRPMAVGLFERRGDLRRRIEMIAKGGGGRRAWVMGAGLTAAVAVVAMTGASSGVVHAADDEVPSARKPLESRILGDVSWSKVRPALQATQPRIEVVRRSEPPEWEERVAEGLAKKTKMNLNETTAAEFLEYMSRVTGLNIVIHPDAQDDASKPEISLTVDVVSADQALRLALRQVEMTYGVVDGVLHVGHFGQVRPTLDQRFYKVAPLIDAIVARLARSEDEADDEDLESYRNSMSEDLITLCQSYVADHDSWCRTGVSMAAWGEVLVVEQDPDTQDAMEEFLNMLLSRGAIVPPAPQWRSALETKLATKVSFDFKDASLASVVAYLAQSTETSIVVAPETAADVTLSLKLSEVTAMEALNWVARQTRLHAAFADGAVVLTRSPPVVLRAYDLSEKFTSEDSVPADAIIELIVTSVEPVSWEEIGSVEYWDEMLIIRNTESVHAQIVEFLEVARKALDK